MKVMVSQATSSANINEQKTYLFLSKSVKLTTKLASYDCISMMQYYVNLPRLSLSPTTKVIHCLPFSQSEVGMRTETTGLNKLVRVKFQLEKECQFGDRIFIIGDDPILGTWNPSDAIPINWSEGYIWNLLLELPVGKSIQYKVLLKDSTGEILWEPGPDRSLQAWVTDNVITVSEEWDNAEAQKLSEEQQVIRENEELMPNTMVEPSVLDSPEDPKKEHVPTMNSNEGDYGSAENAGAENRNGAHLKENLSSSGVKNRKSDRKAQRKEVALRKGNERPAKSDKNSAELEDEGKLVTEDEGPVLVPGLTLLISSSKEDFTREN